MVKTDDFRAAEELKPGIGVSANLVQNRAVRHVRFGAEDLVKYPR